MVGLAGVGGGGGGQEGDTELLRRLQLVGGVEDVVWTSGERSGWCGVATVIRNIAVRTWIRRYS